MSSQKMSYVQAHTDLLESLMPQVVHLGGYVPASPRALVEMRLALSSEEQA